MNLQITTINPFTEAQIKNYSYMTEAEAMAVVEASHKAFLKWRGSSYAERAEILKNIAKELRSSREELAQLLTDEVGKLIKDSRDEVDLVAVLVEYAASEGERVLKNLERPIGNNTGTGIIAFAPTGVIYGIQPWNFPAYQVVRYTMVNLMIGNGVVLKHAENCTGSGLMLKEIFERAGLPKDLFGVLIIPFDVSDKVIAHDYVRGVTMTGSDRAGRQISMKAAEHVKKSVLELGSNDAYMVFDDADMDLVIPTCVAARIYNNGQTCVNAKRFVVTEKRHSEFVERFVDEMKKIGMGDPNSPETKLGPLARKDLRDKLAAQVKESVDKGAKVLCGGEVPNLTGWFYPSTVLTDVAPGQPAYHDELFGPVAAVIKAKDDEDALRIANDSRYGLGGGIFSKNSKRAVELAAKYFDTGMISINSYNIAQPNMPFGGTKNSGYGREHGEFGFTEFANIKSIYVR